MSLGLSSMSILLFLFRALLTGAANRINFHARQFAAMANGTVIPLASPVFEGDDFLVLSLLDNLRSDFRAAKRDLASIDVHDRFERRRLSRFDIKKIDVDSVPLRNAVLAAASFDDCVSHKLKVPGRKKRRNVSIGRQAWQVKM